jgi:hypothetical protein
MDPDAPPVRSGSDMVSDLVLVGDTGELIEFRVASLSTIEHLTDRASDEARGL